MNKSRFTLYISALIIMLSIISCTMNKQDADIIIHNAKVYTVDDDFSIVESFAIKGGKIVKTGTSDLILSEFNSNLVIDVGGRIIYPGFFDAHCHFTGYGLNKLSYAELAGTESFEEIIQILKDHNLNQQPDWLLGRGWDQNDWPVNDFPVNTVLNELFPNTPVLLLRIDGHAALVNDYALQLAGISENTKVDGGEIIMNNKFPTGVLIDNAIDLVRNLVPKYNDDDIAKALLISQENCVELGLTSIADAGVNRNTIDIMDSLHNKNKLKIRIYAMVSPSKSNLDFYSKNGIIETDKLNVRSIKLFADGALGSRGAKLLEPYSDDHENSGLIMESGEYYEEVCKLAFENGFQVNTHAIGDSAVRLMLDIYSKFLLTKNDLRWRIEHAQIVDKNDIDFFGEYSIIPSIQATHATSDMYWAEQRIGPQRIQNAYCYKDLLDQNGWIPNGTDFPVEEINPINTFYASVFRKDKKNYPEDGFQPENALSREEALRSMTIWAAKSCFMESITGSIEIGKFADFIILDNDIMLSDEKEVNETNVLETWISGEKVFSVK